jgi:hypothetical protein
VQYVITVMNRTTTNLTNVSVRQALPPYMVPLRAGFAGDGPFPWNSWSDYGDNGYIDPGEEVEWLLGTLPPGESRSVLYAATILSGPQSPLDNAVLGSSAEVVAGGGAGAFAATHIQAIRRATRLTNPRKTPEGWPIFTLEGEAGFAYTIERSTNLLQWSSIATNVLPLSAVWQFSDSNAGILRPVFYRAWIHH